MAGQLWGTNSLGGYLYNDQLSEMLRTEVRSTCRFRPLCDAQDFTDKGYHTGQLVTWDVVSKLVQSGTVLSEGTAIPETNFTVTQGTATVNEMGIAVPFTSKVQMFSAHSVVNVVRNALSRDCRESLDTEAHNQFKLTRLRYVGTATDGGVFTTNGTATATNSSALNQYHVRTIRDTMTERNIPAYGADDYVAIARPTTLRNLRNQLESVFQYTETGYARIVKGEIGRYEGIRFCEQTHILAGVSFNGSAWSSNKSDWAYFMGADTVAEVVVEPPEIRGAIPGDYGRSLGVAWYAVEGFGIMYSAASDPSGTNSRIVAWDSAA